MLRFMKFSNYLVTTVRGCSDRHTTCDNDTRGGTSFRDKLILGILMSHKGNTCDTSILRNLNCPGLICVCTCQARQIATFGGRDHPHRLLQVKSTIRQRNLIRPSRTNKWPSFEGRGTLRCRIGIILCYAMLFLPFRI
jgi:hypothetical protein